MTPGEIGFAALNVTLFPDAEISSLIVVNAGDRPVQVGSHYHFAEANPALVFDRKKAWGQRLAIASGTSVRFEPGVERQVQLVPIAGRRVVPGLRGASGGPLDGRRQPSGTSGGEGHGDGDGDDSEALPGSQGGGNDG